MSSMCVGLCLVLCTFTCADCMSARILAQAVRFLARKGYSKRLSALLQEIELAWNECEDGSGVTQEDGIVIVQRAAVRGPTVPSRSTLRRNRLPF